MDTCKWIDNYLKWMKKKYSVTSFDDGDEIMTPFTNIIGDRIAIYVSPLDQGKIRLSDDGNTLNDLILLGIDVNSDVRSRIINSIIQSFNVTLSNSKLLRIDGKKEDFPVMKQSLIQTILRINDLVMTRKNNVTNLFLEDVINYFDDNEFKGLPGHDFIGGSGNPYKISYSIGGSKSRPSQLIQILNNPDFQRISSEIVTYEDIKSNDDNINYSVIFNDADHSIQDKAQNIANLRGLDIIPWSDKNSILKLRN
ncbi:MAG: DUF1828 domain-containing protein [Companilactobacillus sp.]|jgi:hypothetical protein|uniref:DUF1828 domain-containing protein n=1 Tax=Companilactobacillus sp. TaxID=2767905 RepID=UPI0025C492E8|nr:DUF1828 domain-containing protein [Companilactobacillus sp.]MCH4010330.1 DUF1828 domain-containing protein [Companilactobacillus sp.]MCH4051994.1 DUF1828 domain-containing protein [Companilactobacillus sp.]MCH4075770.1 DUF1828 domain-containing protein [Companilactobacillus sp.]MCH4126848.1 DUF1828 domain-containing protein [Companilactobacillus sp.]